MPWGAAIAAGAALASGYMGSEASSKAASTQVNASNTATENIKNASASVRYDLSPYRGAGLAAMSTLQGSLGIAPGAPKDYKDWERSDFVDAYKKMFAERGSPNQPLSSITSELENRINDLGNPEVRQYFDDLGLKKFGPTGPSTATGNPLTDSPLLKNFSMNDFQADPGYEFRKSEGEKALTRGASARGLAQSTPGLKDLMSFNSGLASQEFQSAFDRDSANKNRVYSFLAQISGMGQNAAAQTGNSGIGAANAIAGTTMAGANAAAGGIMGAASAQNNAVQGGLANYMYQQRYNQTAGMFQEYMTRGNAGGGSTSNAGSSLDT